jgi:hypothetical protein
MKAILRIYGPSTPGARLASPRTRAEQNAPRRRSCTALIALLACFVALCSSVAEPLPRLPREKLLVYRDAAGSVQPVRSISDWERRREVILRAAEEIMGALPDRTRLSPLDIKVEEEVDAGDHVRRLISYQAELGGRVPAYLLVPKSVLANPSKRVRGVLCLHPTDATRGHKTIVMRSDGVRYPYAIEMVERGSVAIAPAYPLLANYQPNLATLGYASGTMKAIWDNMRALDVLASLGFVEPEALGAIGHSLGGHNAIYTALFDERIRALISSCGFDSYLTYYRGDPKMWQAGNGWTQHRYMPRLAQYAGRFDFHELIGALAPRAVFVSAPLRDSNFQAPSVAQIVTAAAQVYALYGAPDRLVLEQPDCAHDFPESMRDQAYRFLEKQLKLDAEK